jgi:hypothetical protein
MAFVELGPRVEERIVRLDIVDEQSLIGIVLRSVHCVLRHRLREHRVMALVPPHFLPDVDYLVEIHLKVVPVPVELRVRRDIDHIPQVPTGKVRPQKLGRRGAFRMAVFEPTGQIRTLFEHIVPTGVEYQ